MDDLWHSLYLIFLYFEWIFFSDLAILGDSLTTKPTSSAVLGGDPAGATDFGWTYFNLCGAGCHELSRMMNLWWVSKGVCVGSFFWAPVASCQNYHLYMGVQSQIYTRVNSMCLNSQTKSTAVILTLLARKPHLSINFYLWHSVSTGVHLTFLVVCQLCLSTDSHLPTVF